MRFMPVKLIIIITSVPVKVYAEFLLIAQDICPEDVSQTDLSQI